MKKILFVMLMALGLTFVAQAGDKGKGAVIAFEETTHDFGTIKEDGGKVSHVFTFRNTGDAPLLILSATASCGCTKPDFSTEPIMPGAGGEIKVTYNPQGRPGEFVKNINVRTNAKGKRTTLKISGVVVPGK